MKYLIGIDIGTQSVRACIFGIDGCKIAESIVKFNSMKFPAPGYVEQDANEWWSAALGALTEIAHHPDVDVNQIVALSYACTSCTVVALDEYGSPLRPALMWMDERAVKEAVDVEKTHNPVLSFAGGDVSPQWMLPKILWLMRHERETFDRAFRIVEQVDFFTYHLTGKWTLGYNNLVAKWNYAIPLGGWPQGFLEEAGVAEARAKWPATILPIGATVGHLQPSVAQATGLSEETLVIQGGMDATAGMLGLGAFDVGEIGMSHGTSTVIQCQSKTMLGPSISARPDGLAKGYYLVGGGQTTTGSVIQWLLSRFSENTSDSFANDQAQLEGQAASLPPGSNGLIALEFFQGARSPVWDPQARGAIWGLGLWHTSAHLLRAFYEAIAYGVRQFLDQLVMNGYSIQRFSASGGLIRSELATQILSDVCNLPIHLVAEKEQTALGAAIWAGVGIGLFPDYSTAIKKMVQFTEIVQPNSSHKDDYDFYFKKYCQTYDQLKDLMHEVSAYESLRKK
jgi:sugar (pentulose or hexulose) kinase